MMLELLKKQLAEETKFERKTTTTAIILALIVHLIIFVGIREVRRKPKIYVPGKRQVYKPIQIKLPKKQEKMKVTTTNVYKPRNRPIPIAVPNPRTEVELPEIPEMLIEDETPQKIDVGVILAPMLIKKNIPEYPETARVMGTEGEVKVVCTLDKEGRVMRVSLSKSSGADILDKAAMNAAKMCIFTPAMQGNLAVGDIDVEITYKFLLQGVTIEER